VIPFNQQSPENNYSMLKIDLIAGARPNFMKIAPIAHELMHRARLGVPVQFRIIHTGQHYDRNMSDSFFEQLGIPQPDVNLGAGGGTQAEQTAAIMVGYEKLIAVEKPDLCLVVGDVNSTMACAITAQKNHVKVVHVEAGIRSGDWSMPEEINRLVTDSITNYFFTTSEYANANLRNSGVAEGRIFFVGNTMIDTLMANIDRLTPPDLWESSGLKKSGYIVMTLHRPSNVDEGQKLSALLSEIVRSSRGVPLVFPVHPRTAIALRESGITAPNLILTDPMGYLEFNYLVKNSMAVITDSGGITEETTVLGIPCMTLRDTTERPETVSIGTNELLGSNPIQILESTFDRLFAGSWKKGDIPRMWDGKASCRIVDALLHLNEFNKVTG
jgi:UDP-N-acetylglucosamine 2-epimerase (non-hydrolysing)